MQIDLNTVQLKPIDWTRYPVLREGLINNPKLNLASVTKELRELFLEQVKGIVKEKFPYISFK